MQHSPSVSFDSHTLAPIPEELTSHGQFHLTLLASLIKGGATTEAFPEWLVLFGLVYDAHHMRIIAYVPRRKTDVIDCAAYIVDELPLDPDTVMPACEVLLERLRLLSALTTLRRHVLYLSKSLFTTIGPRDGTGRTDTYSCNSESLKRCGSLCSGPHCSSEYSTCPSSVHARELNDLPGRQPGPSPSCRSFASSFCSTCSSLLESASTSDSFYSDDSKYADSSNYMEPSAMSLSQGSHESRGVVRPNKLTGTKRREIIAWARQVIRTEHPVKDTYKMVIRYPHPRRRRIADPKSNIHADRHY